MSTPGTNTPFNIPVLLASVSVLFVVFKLWRVRVEMAKLDGVPTVGSTGFLGSLVSGMRFVKHAREIVNEGYGKYYGRPFKIRTSDHWIVVISGPNLVNDIRKASDEYLSSNEAIGDALQFEYTLGKSQRENDYHVGVVRNALTKNISNRFDDIRNEMMTAFTDEVPVTDDWTTVNAYDTIAKIICKTTNRFLVGLPLCRDPDWIDLNIQFTIDVFARSSIINLFPDILKPIIGNLLSPKGAVLKRALPHIGHVIRERLDKEEQYGWDWEDKPNDLISWLLDENPGGKYRAVEDITMRLLGINMAAIHTTAMVFSIVLSYLAIQPDSVIKALREEIESVVEEHGWNKVSMGYLRKVDSFMKEAARMVGIAQVNSDRKVLKDFTLSDGTRLPAGSFVSIPVSAMHHDQRYFKDPNEFKPFRFADMRDSEENGHLKHQMSSLNSDYFFFGCGKHACPGRFLAVNELKTLVGHTLLTYDVKLQEFKKELPVFSSFGNAVVPNRKLKILFRKRKY